MSNSGILLFFFFRISCWQSTVLLFWMRHTSAVCSQTSSLVCSQGLCLSYSRCVGLCMSLALFSIIIVIVVIMIIIVIIFLSLSLSSSSWFSLSSSSSSVSAFASRMKLDWRLFLVFDTVPCCLCAEKYAAVKTGDHVGNTGQGSVSGEPSSLS